MSFCTSFCAGILLLASGTAFAAAPLLDIDNRVDKFEAFYRDAKARALDPGARFKLWQEGGGLAAVPPGPDGDAMARKLLDAAWDKYPALIPKLGALEKTAEETAREMFARNNNILGTANEPIHGRLILYVGQFDNNAFTMPSMDGKPATVLASIENADLKIVLAHELTHAIHLQLANVKNSFGAPLGETIFLEGLAMHTAQRAVPGLPDAVYTEMPGDHGWFQTCQARKDAVMKATLPDLARSGRVIALKYTFGQGNTGMQREAYCAAWFAMGKLIESGKTLPQLARIPEDQMVSVVRTAMTSW